MLKPVRDAPLRSRLICLGLLIVLIFSSLVFFSMAKGDSCDHCSHPLATSPSDIWPTATRDMENPSSRGNIPPLARARWAALHQQHLTEASTFNGRVVFLGDSITEGWIRTGFSKRRKSLPQPECERIWQDAFGEWNPLNLGIGGDRVQDIGWRLQNGLLREPALQPAVFFLMIGTNDLGAGELPSVVVSEITTVLQQLHLGRPGAKILLQLVLPRGGDLGDWLTEGSFRRSHWWNHQWNNHYAGVTAVNKGLSTFAQTNSWVNILDCSDRFIKRTDQSEPMEYLDPSLMYDLLHLTPLGYQQWAECLKPVLKQLAS